MAAYSSPQAMDRMIKNIAKGIQAEQAIIAALKRDYQSVGDEWNDKQYENLGTVIDDAVRGLSANQAQLSESITRLQLLKAKLVEYLTAHI